MQITKFYVFRNSNGCIFCIFVLSLEHSHTDGQHNNFYLLVAEAEKNALEKYFSIIG